MIRRSNMFEPSGPKHHKFPYKDHFDHELSENCQCHPRLELVHGAGLAQRAEYVYVHRMIMSNPLPDVVPEDWQPS